MYGVNAWWVRVGCVWGFCSGPVLALKQDSQAASTLSLSRSSETCEILNVATAKAKGES